jgi:hypothetical protein
MQPSAQQLCRGLLTVTDSRQEATLSELVSFRWHRLASPEWQMLYEPINEPTLARDRESFCPPLATADRTVLTGQEGEAYDPLRDEPALFRIFARLEDTQEAFLDFARRYGGLDELGIEISRTTESTLVPFAKSTGTLDAWSSRRQELAHAVRLLDALRNGRVADLLHEEYVTRETGGVLGVYRRDDQRPWKARPLKDGVVPGVNWAMSAREPVVVVPAQSTEREIVQHLLSLQVTRQLTGRQVSLTLSPTTKVYGAGLRLTYVVTTLVGALWLQLALAIDGNRDYRPCAGCGNPWDATDARQSRNWCSERCRQRIYRRNREQGAEDHAKV